jgi:hypothetical protein
MELCDNGKLVGRVPLEGHEGGKDAGLKQATTEPSEGKHGSERIMLHICLRQEL